MIKKFLLKTIVFYKKTELFRDNLYKQLHIANSSCRFKPTCSEYSYQAIEKYGSLKGIYLSFFRIIRCHPFNKGGYDPLK